ncbi:MAG: hypothetical protein PHV16_03515, partial [Candidatus Nanoarchaeia archaeon]|nr:hypothetical protein [Candidatus Nanoarchaeia archaeon]
EFHEYTYYTYNIRAKWTLEETPLSGIDYFLYKIEDSYGDIAVNWTETDKENEWVWVDEDDEGNEINLTEGKKYFFVVKAKNNAGSTSQDGISDGVTVDSFKKPSECDDGIMNGYETDKDCGGGECPKCDLTSKCIDDEDCISGFCNSSNRCAEPTCFDEVKNGDETDKDCGGSCDPCIEGRGCKDNSDCKSGKCDTSLGMCTGIDTCENNRLDEDETDVDCGGYCAEYKAKKCSIGENCNKDSDCESGYCEYDECKQKPIEIVIPKNNDEDNDGMPDDWERKYGLKLDFDDSNEDPDGDGLTNYDEHKHGTDPTKKDTDGDGYSDYDEIKKHGTDPNDPNSKPQSSFWPWFLLILGIIFLSAGILYLFVVKGKNKKDKNKPATNTFSSFKPFTPTAFKPSTGTPFRTPPPALKPHESSLELRRAQAMENLRKDRQHFKDHDKVFNTFSTEHKSDAGNKIHGRLDIAKTETPKEPEKPEKKNVIKKTVTKQIIKKTTPKKETVKKEKPKKEKRPKDVFEKLSIVATAELKKYKKKKKK